MVVPLLFLLVGCPNGDSATMPPGSPDGPTGNPTTDGMTPSTDGSGPASAPCPCPTGSYCDLSVNQCKPGCASNSDCTAPKTCDTKTRTCVDLREVYAGVLCGSMTCAKGSVCCVETASGALACTAASACADVYHTPYVCDGSEDCDSATPACCFGKCTPTVSCKDSEITTDGPPLYYALLCHSDADCAGYEGLVLGSNTTTFPPDLVPYDHCCATASFLHGSFCAPAPAAGVSYHCP
jgi:hypothetical protein